MKIKVGDITKIKTGKLDANASSVDGKYPFFTCSKEPLRINTYSYDCECVLVAGNGDLNVKYYNGKFDAYQRTYIIENDSDGLLYMPYLYYFLEGYIEELRKQSIGGVIKYIKLGNLTDAMIELPTIEKQKYIVNLLRISSELINLRKKTINKLDLIIKSRFVEMFGNPVANEKGWKIALCKNLMGKIGSGATPKGGKESYCDEGISLIRSMNVYNNRFEYKDLAHITDDQAEQLENVTIEKKDVLLNITGASVARCCVVPDDLLPARVNQHVSIIRCKERILPEFLCCMFTEDNYQRLLWNIATAGGATREAITKQQIEELMLIVPPIDLQRQYIIFVKRIAKLKVSVSRI